MSVQICGSLFYYCSIGFIFHHVGFALLILLVMFCLSVGHPAAKITRFNDPYRFLLEMQSSLA